ncbi:MAG: hypothetical protein QOD77_2209 [Thermoplasmata archaeon]|nr:hypothetical protein [Thermoplasmata archaeon]
MSARRAFVGVRWGPATQRRFRAFLALQRGCGRLERMPEEGLEPPTRGLCFRGALALQRRLRGRGDAIGDWTAPWRADACNSSRAGVSAGPEETPACNGAAALWPRRVPAVGPFRPVAGAWLEAWSGITPLGRVRCTRLSVAWRTSWVAIPGRLRLRPGSTWTPPFHAVRARRGSVARRTCVGIRG